MATPRLSRARRLSPPLLAALAGAALATPALADPPVYAIHRVGLLGGIYSYSPGPGSGVRLDMPRILNMNGRAVGTSARFGPAATPTAGDLGYDAWAFNGVSSTLIGLTGGAYEWASAGGVYRESLPTGLNASGRAAGHSSRFNAQGDPRGQDAWTFDGSTTLQIGYTGPGCEFTAPRGGGVQRFSEALGVTSSGAVYGYSARYNSLGNGRGRDPWVWTSASGLTRLGLSGTNYEYVLSATDPLVVRNSDVLAFRDTGVAAGHAQRYAPSGLTLGQDVWLYDGLTTAVIGLTDAAHSFSLPGDSVPTRLNTLKGLNSAGRAVGNANRYDLVPNATGQDAWYFNGGTTNVIGLTGPGYEFGGSGPAATRSASAFGISETGRAAGATSRYDVNGNERGQDAWVSFGGPTTRIGLTGGPYESTSGGSDVPIRTSTVRGLSPGGVVFGDSLRYHPTTAAPRGQDAWVFDGAVTTPVGLTGGLYEWPSAGVSTRSSTALAATDTGLAIGTSARYTPAGGDLGQAGWFWNSTLGTTTELLFSTRPDGYGVTLPAVLTDSGVVLGSYKRFSGSTLVGDRAFWWSPADGFYDLGALIPGFLPDWSYLTNVAASAGLSPLGQPRFITGTGALAGGPTTGAGYVLSIMTIPTAPTAAPLALLAAIACRRRR
jgi:hypothetical protein